MEPTFAVREIVSHVGRCGDISILWATDRKMRSAIPSNKISSLQCLTRIHSTAANSDTDNRNLCTQPVSRIPFEWKWCNKFDHLEALAGVANACTSFEIYLQFSYNQLKLLLLTPRTNTRTLEATVPFKRMLYVVRARVRRHFTAY